MAWLLTTVPTSQGLSHQTGAVPGTEREESGHPLVPASGPTCAQRIWPRWGGQTHDPVLHAEAQLVLEVGPLDEDCGDRRTADDVELHLSLVLQTLQSGVGDMREP